MLPRKTDRPDRNRHYTTFIEVGLIGSLLFLIAVFTVGFDQTSTFGIPEARIEAPPEILPPATKIERPKPPPPRPPVPIVQPDDAELEFDPIDIDHERPPTPDPTQPPPPPPVVDDGPRDPFWRVEVEPNLESGLAQLQKLIRYPEIAVKAGVQGTVMLEFTIDTLGRVVDPVVTRGIGAGCDEEALRALQLVTFTPGRQRDKPVEVRRRLPVRFKLR